MRRASRHLMVLGRSATRMQRRLFSLALARNRQAVLSAVGLSNLPLFLKGPNKDTEKKSDSNDDKKKNGDEDEPNGEGGDEDDSLKDEVTPKVVRLVIGIFAFSWMLYFFSKPSGKHVGWKTITENASRITDIRVYHYFCQVYLGAVEGDENSSKQTLFVGVVDDDHTDKKVKSLSPHMKGPDQQISTKYEGTPAAETVLHGLGVVAWVIPFIFFPSFVMILTRTIGMSAAAIAQGEKRGSSNIKQMQFKVHRGHNTKFKDIAGMKEAKREVTELVDFLKQPERFQRLGAKIPTGALLLGPPGTGKTLLAKAVAGEAGVAFIPVCGSDFVELYVGMGALRVRQLFELAKKQRCIIYIDEIDAIGLKRQGAGHGEKQEQEHTLNELLTQLDGFGSSRGDVMILASSNVSQDSLDSALIRPGRFDRLVHVDAPVISERIDIFKVHLKKLLLEKPVEVPPADSEKSIVKDGSPLDEVVKNEEVKEEAPPKVDEVAAIVVESSKKTEEGPPKEADAVNVAPESKETALTVSEGVTSVNEDGEEIENNEPFSTRDILIQTYAKRMSSLCPGFVGADIANVCNEGAILATRENASHVDVTHLERSIDRVLAGIEHRSRVLSDFEKNVVAHHEAGHAIAGWFLGRADPLMKVSIVPRGGSALGYAQYLPNENMLRTANEILDSICVTLGGRVAEKIFFDHLSTGASDDLRKVTKMAYSHVSSFNTTTAFHSPGSSATRYVKPFGSLTSDRLDLAAKELVDEAYDKTYKLLLSKKKEMKLLADHLLKHEVLTHADVVSYLGTRGDRPEDKKQH